ncbi:hypothetical protein BGZ92_010546 [Podila epicladia]|nr:hypothetical protein BGZ92_010546 [Podila epicladia]
MAALLHDVIEDQGVTKAELTERFGSEVAELVDGLSKLDKMEFRSKEEAQAENFRKMLLAMARDVRIILIKLADRLHNMRTLGAVPAEKRQRVARWGLIKPTKNYKKPVLKIPIPSATPLSQKHYKPHALPIKKALRKF